MSCELCARHARDVTLDAIADALDYVGWGEPEDSATFAYCLVAMVKAWADAKINGGDLPPPRGFPWPEHLQGD